MAEPANGNAPESCRSIRCEAQAPIENPEPHQDLGVLRHFDENWGIYADKADMMRDVIVFTESDQAVVPPGTRLHKSLSASPVCEDGRKLPSIIEQITKLDARLGEYAVPSASDGYVMRICSLDAALSCVEGRLITRRSAQADVDVTKI